MDGARLAYCGCFSGSVLAGCCEEWERSNQQVYCRRNSRDIWALEREEEPKTMGPNKRNKNMSFNSLTKQIYLYYEWWSCHHNVTGSVFSLYWPCDRTSVKLYVLMQYWHLVVSKNTTLSSILESSKSHCHFKIVALVLYTCKNPECNKIK